MGDNATVASPSPRVSRLALLLLAVAVACTTKGDADGDGFPDGVDCADWDPEVNPDAPELCDGSDNNCDGYTDHEWAEDATTWYIDYDGDGHGSDAYVLIDCDRPDGYVSLLDDCLDVDASVYPGAREQCDLLDNDCDGDIDEDAPGASEWYIDADRDGHGSASDVARSCAQPAGYVGNAGDCDDADPTVHSGATELCDDLDNDCDGLIDDGAGDAVAWYLDADGDSYGDPDDVEEACEPPDGRVLDASDCDDGAPDVNPGMPEVCEDGLDNDCDETDNGCAPDGVIALADADGVIRGTESYDNAGTSVSSAGDQNGDGLGDVLVGVAGSDGAGDGAGAVMILLGPLLGSRDLDEADGILQGSSSGDAAGSDVALVGDVNGDGVPDLGVGAPSANTPDVGAGVAYVVYGPVTGTMRLAEAELRLRGGDADADLGRALAGPGDVDGDGWGDLLVGAPGLDTEGDGAGAAFLVSGPLSGLARVGSVGVALYGYGDGALAGRSVAGPGDLDGDGFPDMLVGAPGDEAGGSYAGAAYLVSGPVTEALLLSHDGVALRGQASGDGAGWSVAGLGDQDGDGYGDVLIGAYGADGEERDSGVAYVMCGPVRTVADLSDADAVLNGSESRAYAGYRVAGPGDMNRDGYVDLAVGARGSDLGATDGGATYLLYGPVSGSIDLEDAPAIFLGSGAGDLSGTAIGAAGDVDGNGYSDLIIGGPAADGEASSSGGAWVILGSGL